MKHKSIFIVIAILILLATGSAYSNDNNTISINTLRQHLKPGMTKAYVTNTLGYNYIEMNSPTNQNKMWVYSQLSPKHLDPSGKYVPSYFADIDNIINGTLSTQIFIEWEDGLSKFATVYYMENGNVHMLSILPNDTEDKIIQTK